ncbi:MAG: GAF domain-containing protein [Desulfobacterales bacterium]|nr:GAF domain-containing protein [Desulfobacterales bacterium]MCP4163395.1 GAF domain-containing protein [Deltaproteobacteria bacterium]
MTLKQVIVSSFSGMAVGNIILAVIIIMLTVNQTKLNKAYEARYQSYSSANELRQSSNDLTRFARTYVVTGDEKYEKMYWDVLAIRDGEKPRPENYERIYWDFVLEYGDKPRPDAKKIPLKTIMQNLGFTTDEFALLNKAQANSDSLVTTETIAMNAVKGLFDDGKKKYTKKGEPDPELAIQIMHNNKYHKDKLHIMAPIDEFLKKLDVRTKSVTQALKRTSSQFLVFAQVLVLLLCMLAVFFGFYVSKYVFKNVGGDPSEIETIASEIAKGNFNIKLNEREKTGILKALVKMSKSLKKNADENEINNWLKEASAELNICMQGEQSLDELGQNICSFLAKKMDAAVGAFYVSEDDGTLTLKGGFSINRNQFISRKIALGGGVLGQVMQLKESIILNKLPKNYMQITSGLVETTPQSLLVFPFVWNDRVEAIVELGTINQFTKLQRTYLDKESKSIAVNIASVKSRNK